MEVQLRLAQREDLARCCAVLDDGRQFQRQQGFVQWADGFPGQKEVLADIACGGAYVAIAAQEIAAYFFLGFAPDPFYAEIDGAWGADLPYAVIHRMAVSAAFRGSGVASEILRQIELLCLAHSVTQLRIDTAFPNRRMQHFLEKNGFVYRGVITIPVGLRMAYDKALSVAEQ